MKILQIERWMDFEAENEIKPLLFRDGLYLLGNFCWYEVRGKAFMYDKQNFLFTFNLLCASEYNQKQYLALLSISSQKLATKKQLKLLYFMELLKELRTNKIACKKIKNRMII